MMDKRFIEPGLILTMDHCEVKDGLEVGRVVAGNVELEVLGFKVAADVIHTLDSIVTLIQILHNNII